MELTYVRNFVLGRRTTGSRLTRRKWSSGPMHVYRVFPSRKREGIQAIDLSCASDEEAQGARRTIDPPPVRRARSSFGTARACSRFELGQ